MTSSEAESKIYEFDIFRLETAASRLIETTSGTVLPLSPKTIELLIILVQNSNRIVNKETILDSLWHEQFVEENNLTVRISELRKVLGEKRGEKRYIETVPRLGYRFVAKVRVTEDVNENIKNEVNSIAVLPFVNETGDPDFEYLSDGVTENIINNLSQLNSVKIIARNNIFRFKEVEINLQLLSQQLGVQAVLSGRIRRLSNNLIVGAELVNIQNNSQIWGGRYNYQQADLFKLEQEITEEISTKLKLQLTSIQHKHLTNRYTQNWEVYILYLRGRYFWYKRSLKGISYAIKYFKWAIEKDPSYALAYSGLADCHTILFSCGFQSSKKSFPKARALVMKSLELDDSLAEAHASLAYIEFYGRNWAEAEKEFARSINLNSNYAEARYWFASYLAATARFDEAFFELDKAQQIDLLSLAVSKTHCKVLYLAGRHDEAIQKCLEALEIDTDHVGVRGILGLTYLKKLMYEEAIKEFEKILKLHPQEIEFLDKNEPLFEELWKKIFSLENHSESIGVLGYMYAIIGKRNLALELLEGLLTLSKQRYTEPHSIAFIYIGLGRENQAFEWLAKLHAEEHAVSFLFWKDTAIFDNFRSNLRFRSLLQRLKVSL